MLGYIYGNGLGVGQSANMGDFNPWTVNTKYIEVHRGVSNIVYIQNTYASKLDKALQSWGDSWKNKWSVLDIVFYLC